MIALISRKSFISVLLIVSILFSVSASSAPLNVSKEDAEKIAKWATIGGVAVSALIGAATFGIGGFIIGGAIGALTTSLVCDFYGIRPQRQWELVFPNLKMPFKYNRQTQGGLGVNIPANGPSASQTVGKDASFAEKVRDTYQKAYQNYNDALQKSKDSGLIKKAHEAYQKAKSEFDKLK